jgi:hypothetical protein
MSLSRDPLAPASRAANSSASSGTVPTMTIATSGARVNLRRRPDAASRQAGGDQAFVRTLAQHRTDGTLGVGCLGRDGEAAQAQRQTDAPAGRLVVIGDDES